ncbi:hypothetical protein K439DRAFT_1611072 [Ramaria rubella]|nr:hypothetical protein K439DRAFT_1611072 [Ramaria rubella]
MASRNMSSHSRRLLPFRALHTHASMADLTSTALPFVAPTPPPTTPLLPIPRAPSVIVPAAASRFDRTKKESRLDDIAAELAIACEIAQDLEDELWMMLEKHATNQSDTQTEAEMAAISECQVPFALIHSILRLGDLQRATRDPHK